MNYRYDDGSGISNAEILGIIAKEHLGELGGKVEYGNELLKGLQEQVEYLKAAIIKERSRNGADTYKKPENVFADPTYGGSPERKKAYVETDKKVAARLAGK